MRDRDGKAPSLSERSVGGTPGALLPGASRGVALSGGRLPETAGSFQDLARPKPASSVAMRAPKQTIGFSALRRTSRIGAIALIVFGLLTYVLLAKAVIAGAVIATGQLVVESGPKPVQHPAGGVIETIHVKEGDRVEAGAPVLSLDAEAARAQLVATETSIAFMASREARLVAERDGLEVLPSPRSASYHALPDSERLAILRNEAFQFELRKRERENRREQLRQRIAQLESSIASAELRLGSTRDQLKLVDAELVGLRNLAERRLVPLQRLNAAEAAVIQLRATEGSLLSEIAAAKSQIAETTLAIDQVDGTLRAALTDQIADTRSQVAELVQKQIIDNSELEQRIVRAPRSGVIYQLAFAGAGEVLGPRQVAAVVVPDDETLIAETRISPNDIDQVFPGQDVMVILSAFDRGTTPQLVGTLESVSPAPVIDEATNASFYEGRVRIEPDEIARMGTITLVPGMPVETFIRTVDRSILSYLLKPVMDQFRRALR